MIVCKRCGFKNQDDDADFCASCGRFLEWTGEKVEQVAAPEAAAPAPEEDEAGRKGLIERAGDWVREKSSGAPGEGAPADGGVLVAEADKPATVEAPAEAPAATAATTAAGPALPSTEAPAAAAAAGPTLAEASAPAPATDGPPVFGPSLPSTGTDSDAPAAGDGEARPAAAVATAAAAATVADEKPAPVMPAAATPSAAVPSAAMPGPSMPGATTPTAAGPAPVTPSSASDPLLSALIASPVAVVPAAEEARRPVQPVRPDLGGTEGDARREAAPERQPGSAQPSREVFRPAQYTKEASGPTRVVREGDIVCPRCGQGNYPWRNYCRRCGLVLDHVKAHAERRGPWRWLWAGLSQPVHRRRRKLVRAGDRPGRKLRSSPRARGTTRRFQVPHIDKKKFARYLPVLMVLFLLFGFLGPWKKSFRSTYQRWKNDVLKTVDINYTQVFPVTVTASTSANGHTPENANDNSLSTFWLSAAPPQPVKKKPVTCPTTSKTSTSSTTTTTVKGAKPPTCTSTSTTTTTTTTTTVPKGGKPKPKPKPKPLPTGVGQFLLLDFTQPENIGGFALFTGAQDTPADFNNYEKPKQIELIFSNGFSIYESVSEAKTLQTWKFAHPSTSFLKIVVTQVYPGAGTTVQKEQVAISDVFAYVLS